ncbi:unnamed protein product [Calypogeia fissa]
MHEVLRALGRSIAGQSRVCFDVSNPLPTWLFDEGMMEAIREVKVLKIYEVQRNSLILSKQNISVEIGIHGLHRLEELQILWLHGVGLYGPSNLLPPNLAFMRIQGRTWTSLHPRLYSAAEGSLPTYAPRGTQHLGQHPMLRHLEICSVHIAKDVTDALGELQALECLQIESQDWEAIPEAFGQLWLTRFMKNPRILKLLNFQVSHLQGGEFLPHNCTNSNRNGNVFIHEKSKDTELLSFQVSDIYSRRRVCTS